MPMDTTFDGLLNKRVKIEQPAEGYRISVDTVLLAAAVPAHTAQKVLDMGCGVGGAMLCLTARVPGVHITGIDIQNDLIDICRRNIELNNLVGSAKALVGDITEFFNCHLRESKDPALDEEKKWMPAFVGLTHEKFDHVIMNPPFHEEEKHAVSDNIIKRTANAERTGDLPLWITAAAHALNPVGVLTLIHRADRQGDILQHAEPHFSAIDILPIISKEGVAPKRIILRMRKDEKKPTTICNSFVMYGSNNRYCDAAEAVIRHCEGLGFTHA